jgi:hypothetical protein
MQDRPFIHIDSDAFLWKPLPQSVTNAPVFAQSPEFHPPLDAWSDPSLVEAAFAKHALPLPVEWEWWRSLGETGYREESCGIVGGQRPDFLRHYAQLGLQLVRDPAHAPAWRELPDKSNFNMTIEQFLLAACLDYHRFHPESPYRGVRIKYLFQNWADAFDPAKCAQAGYTHLLGDSKCDAAVMQRLEQRMRSEDRDFYSHCLRLGQRMARV